MKKIISVFEVTVLDSDSVSITIYAITQDELVNGTGDIDTFTDGARIGISTAQV